MFLLTDITTFANAGDAAVVSEKRKKARVTRISADAVLKSTQIIADWQMIVKDEARKMVLSLPFFPGC